MIVRKYTCFKLLVLVCVLATSTPLYAHLIGASYEEEIGGYLVDVGYNPELILSEERMRFDFALYEELDNGQWTRKSFTDVWVRITQDQKVFFAGGISNPNFGTPGFMFIFPSAGEYTVYVRYQNNGNRIVETSFPVFVQEGLVGDANVTALDLNVETKTGIIIFTAGTIFGLFLLSLYRRSTPNLLFL